MKMPQIRASKLTSAILAGGVALSVLLGPAILPPNAGGSAARAEINIGIGIDLFQRELSPYGRWAEDPRYGEVWYPSVRVGWRPYYDDGHWVYSDDYGWLWVADQPWGWAPFHYGRWVLTDYGWAWVPGTVWGPAWVTFRSAPDYIGWAPLPPDADWDDGYGFRRRYAVDDDRYWSFVRPQGFLERRFDRYAYDRRDNRRFIQHTTNITNITIINNRVVNRGIDVNHVERETHRRVQRVVVSDSDRPDRTLLKGNKVVIYKPAVVDGGGDRKTRRDLRNANQGAPAQQFETNQQLRKKRNNQNQAPEFNQPEQTQPSFGTNEQPQLLRKKKRDNQNQAPEFNQPEQAQPSFGTNEQPQQLRKKKRNNQNQAPEFNQPEQVQPSFGTNEQPQQLRKKKRNNQNQAPEFNQPEQAQPSFGMNEQPQTRKKRQQQQQFTDQPQAQQQFQPQEQQNNTRQLQKKNKRQCQNGDASACGG